MDGPSTTRRHLIALGLVALATLTACFDDQLLDVTPVEAVAYGTATVSGTPAAGLQVTAEALSPSCARPSSAAAVVRTDSLGRYRAQVRGAGAYGLRCLRVSVGIAPLDTLVRWDSVTLRSGPPYDSVQVDLRR